MVRSIHVLTFALSLTILPWACSTALAQVKTPTKKGAETISGTVVSVEKEKTGKNYRMKMKSKEDDEEFDVPLLVKTHLSVNAKGDDGFLRPNVFIQTKVVQTGGGMDFFAKEFTVFLGNTPAPYVKQDESEKTVYEVSGKIIMVDNSGLILQCGTPEPQKISFESEKTVNVKSSDPTRIKEGDVVEVEGTHVKGKKQLNAFAVTVTSAADINSDEYFAAQDEKKKPKTATKSKTTKSKTDAPAVPPDSDPFNVRKKKGAKESDTKKEDSKDAKKDDAAKTDEKPAKP